MNGTVTGSSSETTTQTDSGTNNRGSFHSTTTLTSIESDWSHDDEITGADDPTSTTTLFTTGGDSESGYTQYPSDSATTTAWATDNAIQETIAATTVTSDTLSLTEYGSYTSLPRWSAGS